MPDLSSFPDAMSDALSLVRMHGEVVCAVENGAPWSLSFHKPVSYFHIVDHGALWLIQDGAVPVRLIDGDLVILPLGGGHVLTTDPALPATPIETAIPGLGDHRGGVMRFGGPGESASLMCGQFGFDGVLASRLLQVLPPIVHIRPDPGHPLEWIRLTRHFLADEAYHPKPGSAIMIARLIELLFIQAIREWGVNSPGSLGWLGGLNDPQIGRALAAIHNDPAHTWTVEKLALIAGFSRSVFAARFTHVVGQTPLKYVTAWRLNLAADHLRSGSMKIGEIAAVVGYGSEAALSRAFKAQFGISPAAFRRATEIPGNA